MKNTKAISKTLYDNIVLSFKALSEEISENNTDGQYDYLWGNFNNYTNLTPIESISAYDDLVSGIKETLENGRSQTLFDDLMTEFKTVYNITEITNENKIEVGNELIEFINNDENETSFASIAEAVNQVVIDNSDPSLYE